MSNFIEKCLQGEALLEEIDDYVDAWHESPGESTISQFLGFTADEYKLWLEKPSVLGFIVFAHKQKVPVAKVIQESAKHSLAARAGSREDATALVEWLRVTNRIQ